MSNGQSGKIGHSILRYKVRLYDRHFSWLVMTRQLYVTVVSHFFAVLQKKQELLDLSDFLLLRALETLCIGTKDMKKAGEVPEFPLKDVPKIPLYFRRSAINAAIDLARKKAAVQKLYAEATEQDFRRVPMVFYQGMYREFGENSIELKLYDGQAWKWVTYPFTGRKFPAEAKRLSPILMLEKKTAWLEVPLSFPVSDIRTVKERMKEEERILAVAFPDADIMAAAVIFTKEGEEQTYRLFYGGRRKEHQRREILSQIAKSQKSRGILDGKYAKDSKESLPRRSSQENLHLFEKLEQINTYYIHKISRELVEYCLEQHIKVIVVPNYESDNMADRKQVDIELYRWLGRGIIKKLKYKAFQQGIVVTTVRPYGLSHVGEQACNTARTIGKRFLSYVQE